MRQACAVLAVVLAACGGGNVDAPVTDASPTSDAVTPDAVSPCTAFVTFDPPMPLAHMSTIVRATIHVANAPGVLTYAWTLTGNGAPQAFTMAAADNSAIEFPAAVAGPYVAQVVIGGTTEACPSTPYTVNVGVPGANAMQVRMRIYPPAAIAAPPVEKLVLVNGGANFSVGFVTLDGGLTATGTVTSGGAPVAAYLRFIPLASREAYLEAFSSMADGGFSVRVLNQPHDVLIVPSIAGLAPRLVTNWTPGTNLTVTAGVGIGGVVRDPANAAVAGAKVQLTVAGIPTTLTTTDATGAFTVRAHALTGAATLEVTAPGATGLPRLIAASTALDLSQPVTARYDAGLVIRDLAGAIVRRNAVAQPGARVSLVGTITTAGTFTTGVASAPAAGEVRVVALADGAGALPTTRVPATVLTAVTQPTPANLADVALATLDLQSGTPAIVDAPAMTPISPTVQDGALAPVPGAVFEATPTGEFAMAGVGGVRTIAGANGVVTTSLATAGTYDLHVTDPRGLAAPFDDDAVAAGGVTATVVLPNAVRIDGTLMLAGNPQPIGGAAIQILCVGCTGLGHVRPIAEGSSSSSGVFAVGVFDPGTM